MKTNTKLLRAQRNTLLELDVTALLGKEKQGHIDGLINYLDAILDEQEGYSNTNEQEGAKSNGAKKEGT